MLPLVPSLFVQPHFDDVPLSCGATAAWLARSGLQPTVLTVFASDIVPSMVGDFAKWKHERWRLTDIDAVIETRRSEDLCATQVLGCRSRWLGFPDAIYRVGRYECDDQLYGALLDEELGLAAHLANEIIALPEWRPGTRLFVPLGAGQHVDHQIAFEAGRLLALRGVEVWAYEDLPYAMHTPSSVQVQRDQIGTSLSHSVAQPVADTLELKLESIACYASQLPVLFRFTTDWRQAVRRHAETISPAGAERFWKLKGH